MTETAKTPASGDAPRILVISQVYVPDPAAVGQYMADAAAELAARGYRVRVLTSRRGYADPTVKFPARQTLSGVDVVRLPLSSFGKATILHRLLGQVSFLVQVLLRGLFTPGLAGLIVSTSPPFASPVAVGIGWLRRVPVKYWVMDVNPDQMIELGKLKPTSLAARFFNALNRLILRNAETVVALDRFMADRLLAKHDVRDKMTVMPPWPHVAHLEAVEHADNPFRKEHGLEGKFVIMYSGNHGFSTPVDTVVEAALRLQQRRDLVFLFIGEGVGKKVVDDAIAERAPSNLRSLPYQPLERTRFSLSAADVHLVTVGNDVVGVVHPCKVYGAMALGRPILLLGPDPCHVSDLIDDEKIGWRTPHGDVDAAVAVIEAIAATPADELRAKGERAAELTRTRFNSERMLDEFSGLMTRGLPPAWPAPGDTPRATETTP